MKIGRLVVRFWFWLFFFRFLIWGFAFLEVLGSYFWVMVVHVLLMDLIFLLSWMVGWVGGVWYFVCWFKLWSGLFRCGWGLGCRCAAFCCGVCF